MIVGIVLFSFAMKTIVAHVDEQLDWVTSFALCGGCTLYLLTSRRSASESNTG